MDEQTKRLIALLKEAVLHAADESVSGIICEAREEAFAEARSVLKELMVQAVLERALAEMTARIPPPADTPVQPDPGVQESEAQIRAEIAAIKAKMAENEQLLGQTSAPGSKPQPTQISPREDQTALASHATGEPEEAGEGCYVYCIVGRGACQWDGLVGIDPENAVYQVPYREIEAVVSHVPLDKYGPDVLKTNLNDGHWLETRVYAHQRVLEAVLADSALVPMRFCTIYRDETGVRDLLVQYYDRWVEHLTRLEGKQEWGVKVYCDLGKLMAQVERVSAQVRALREEMSQKPEGAAYFMRKKLEALGAAEAERISDEYAQRVHDHLSTLSEELLICPLPAPELTEEAGTMVLNGAYLVTAERLPAFRAALDSLIDEDQDVGFSHQMTGPWPPYNFVSIDVEESMAHESVGC